MKLTFITAGDTPLTKTFRKTGEKVEVESYPMARNVSSVVVDVANIEQMYEAIDELGREGFALIKGRVNRTLVNESRMGSTNALESTEWLCLDLDFDEGFDNVEDCLRAIDADMPETAHIVQYSASSGVTKPHKLRSHVFFLLDKPVYPSQIKNWLTSVNLRVPALRDQLRLTASKITLRYPLDPTVAQNDKLIFIAPPRFDGMEDPLGPERMQIVPGHPRLDTAVFGSVTNAAAAANKQIACLRAAENLPEKPSVMKTINGIVVAKNPDEATVTGIKKGRGFTYLNLNGGDSWGYYHTDDNPDVLLNFKNEPAYRLSEIVPDYWRSLQEAAAKPSSPAAADGVTPPDASDEPEPVLLAFREIESDQIYNGWFKPDTQDIEIYACSRSSLKDFFESRGKSAPKIIHDWRVTFDPRNTTICDFERRVINTFRQTPLMLAEHEIVETMPEAIGELIHHVLGEDHEAVSRFLNWLAFIWQTRRKTGTAWLLHGTEGTGKGVLLKHVLRPLFGTNVMQVDQSFFTDRFNGGLESNLLCWIDEVHINETREARRIMDVWKKLITEPTLVVRNPYCPPLERPNYSNLILATNSRDPIELSATARRFNVPPRQERPLRVTNAFVADLQAELPRFAALLNSYPLNESLVDQPLESTARAEMTAASSDSIEDFFRALTEGDLAFFADYIEPTVPLTDADAYRAFYAPLRRWAAEPETCRVSANEARNVYCYLTGNDISPLKFGKMASKRGYPAKTIRIGNQTPRGWLVQFKGTEALRASIGKTGQAFGPPRTAGSADNATLH